MKTSSFKDCMLLLIAVAFQAACFAGHASPAAPAIQAQGEQPVYDVVVYGDSSGAVIAAVATIADLEGLDAHANAVKVRLATL